MPKISGITIELKGDASGLIKSLKSVDGQLRQTQTALKDINKLLKLDPSNTELLRQKQKYLQEAIKQTGVRLEELKKIQSQYAEGSDEWNAIQREIIETEQKLKSLEKEYESFGSVAAQQIKAAGQKMVAFGNKVSDVGNKLKPLSRTAAAIGAGLVGLGYKAVQTADDLDTLSQQTGFTTEEIQKMQYASDLVDVSFDSISGALKKLKKNMTGQADTWEKLGISVTDADGNMRSATEVFYESLTALSQIENETERDQVAMTLFGKSADELAGIIDDGGAALKEYGDQAKELGLIMDDDMIGSMNSLNDTIDELKNNFKGTFLKLGSTIATTLAPALEKVRGKLEAVAEWIRNLTPEQAALILKVTGLVAALAPLLVIGGKLITGIGTLLMFAPMISTVFGFLSLKMLLIPVAIAGIIAAGVWLVKNWKTVIEWAGNLKDKVVQSITNLKNGVKAGWEQTKADAASSWDTIKTTVTSKVDAVKTAIVNKFNALKSSVSSIWNSIKTSITTAINNAKSAVQTAVNTIKEAFNFNWQMPQLKVPHITVEWEEGAPEILKFFGVSRIPRLKVSWQKKAYENPVMFTSPTVLATPNGLKGFGDGNGAEIVMGLEKLQQLVGASGDVIINVYPSQGMDVNQLADQIQDRFIQLQKQRSLAYA